MPEYHGIVFTRMGILALVEEQGLLKASWDITMPEELGAFIEAQVWNFKILAD
jgi:hypothetical protein